MKYQKLALASLILGTFACGDVSSDTCRELQRETLVTLKDLYGVNSADGLARVDFIEQAKTKYGELESVHRRVLLDNFTDKEKKELLNVYGIFYLKSSLTLERYDIFTDLLEYGISPFSSDEYFLSPLIGIFIDQDNEGFNIIKRVYGSQQYPALDLVQNYMRVCNNI